MAFALSDIKTQLNQLIYAGFVEKQVINDYLIYIAIYKRLINVLTSYRKIVIVIVL